MTGAAFRNYAGEGQSKTGTILRARFFAFTTGLKSQSLLWIGRKNRLETR
jgi:hypothetical protein